jgi:preprotein translocase subunit SecB
MDDVSPKLSIDISVEGKDDRKNNQFVLKMDFRIWDEKENMKIQVVASGLFEFDPDCTEKELGSYFNTNAPALIFPYLRAYITSLTALSGTAPVILPTLNLAHLGEKLKNNTRIE